MVGDPPPPPPPQFPPLAGASIGGLAILKGQWVAWAGAVGVVLGSLLPWASGPFGISVSGTSGDGVITLICGIIVAGVAFRLRRTWAKVVCLLAAVLAVAVGVYHTADLSSTSGLSIGFGLVLTDAGALACVTAVVMAIRER